MLGEIIAVAKSTFSRFLSAAGRLFKRLLRPAPATVVAGVVQDAVRSKCELVAENAMLRQQLIVAGRAVKRPSLRNGDRLFMVCLPKTRFSRDHGHLSRPVPSHGMPGPGGGLRMTVSADAAPQRRRRG